MPDTNNDEQDNLSVPAGPFRVVPGLSLLAVGSLVAILGRWYELNILGWIAFFGSFFVMLKRQL